uniref:Glycosyl hydrolase family 31 C-terminal domain-containing protein n=1 Tax=Haptolina ericina TaxID=156174 RepID=A0A7S3C706_9EUKA|mmetsp:Transcript_8832/g.19688  ORF Transcript_8832/g.19688 Transcript_8832/m.19688 type:complete len:151 (+) Transcript_8832:2-454(+)
MTCPIFRQHGERNTEPWLLGNVSFTAVMKVMALRQSLRPYIESELAHTAFTGFPFNRPLLFDFPADAPAWGITDQYMVGRHYMAAPVYAMGQRSRAVYFPSGSNWTHYFTGEMYAGGSTAVVDAPLNEFPLFAASSLNVHEGGANGEFGK